MQAIIAAGRGRAAALRLAELPTPEPAAHELLVAVHATSVNPKDWKLNRSIAALFPKGVRGSGAALFGDDLSGTVVAAGAAVTDFAVGDAVYGMDMRLRTAACAEYAVIDQRRVAHKPAAMSHEEAAGVPLAAQTALQAFRKGGLEAGGRVLIIGASGGVGTYAVQIAKAMAAEVTAVCSGRNVGLVEGLGADAVIDYTQEDFHRRGGAFDVVFDATSHDTPARCAGLLRKGGAFVSTGGYAGAYLGVARARLMPRQPASHIVIVESHRRDLETLGAWIEAGRLRTVIDGVYPLAELGQAYDRSRSGRARGKIIVRVRGD